MINAEPDKSNRAKTTFPVRLHAPLVHQALPSSIRAEQRSVHNRSSRFAVRPLLAVKIDPRNSRPRFAERLVERQLTFLRIEARHKYPTSFITGHYYPVPLAIGCQPVRHRELLIESQSGHLGRLLRIAHVQRDQTRQGPYSLAPILTNHPCNAPSSTHPTPP